MPTAEEVNAMNGPQLVAAFNAMKPEQPVKRFENRAAGVRRVMELISKNQYHKGNDVRALSPRGNTMRGKIMKALKSATGTTIAELSELIGKSELETKMILEVEMRNLKTSYREVDGRLRWFPKIKGRSTWNREPGTKSVREPTSGSKRAKIVELLSDPAGITYIDLQTKMGLSLQNMTEALRILRREYGYGLREDENGKIRIYRNEA